MVWDLNLKTFMKGEIRNAFKTGYEMVVCGWGQFWDVLVGMDDEQLRLLMKMSSLSYRWNEQSAMW